MGDDQLYVAGYFMRRGAGSMLIVQPPKPVGWCRLNEDRVEEDDPPFYWDGTLTGEYSPDDDGIYAPRPALLMTREEAIRICVEENYKDQTRDDLPYYTFFMAYDEAVLLYG